MGVYAHTRKTPRNRAISHDLDYYVNTDWCKLSLINYIIREEPMTIVLSVGGAHLRVFLGNSILDDTNMI